MADSRPYTATEKAAQDAATKKANETNATVLGRANVSKPGYGGAGRQSVPDDGPVAPDYSKLGMVERGVAMKKFMKAREEWEKKKAEQAAVRSMK